MTWSMAARRSGRSGPTLRSRPHNQAPAARNELTHGAVALKVIPDPSLDNCARLLREAQLVNRIGSPGVAKVTDAGSLADGRPYLVMELLVGESLGQRLERIPRPPLRDTLRIMSDVLEILAAAHAARTIHRDLKPENVFLVDRDGRPDFVKIVDFGIAKVTPLDASGQVPASPRPSKVLRAAAASSGVFVGEICRPG